MPPTEILNPLLLASATLSDYAQAVQRLRDNEIWWYFNQLTPHRGSAAPFADDAGGWWYCVKPRFAWPVDFFTPLDRAPRLPRQPRLFGRQYPVAQPHANSRVCMNVILDLAGYDLSRVASDKRRAVRKGLSNLHIAALDPADAAVQTDACTVWNSHVERTGWNKPYALLEFRDSWSELADTPGTTVLGAYDASLGDALCAWLIVRVFADTVWIDTIASHSDRQANRPNDTLIYAALAAATAQGIAKHAHYSLYSGIVSLERFKTSLGFSAVDFPCKLEVRTPIKWGLRLLRPRIWKRLCGETERVER